MKKAHRCFNRRGINNWVIVQTTYTRQVYFITLVAVSRNIIQVCLEGGQTLSYAKQTDFFWSNLTTVGKKMKAKMKNISIKIGKIQRIILDGRHYIYICDQNTLFQSDRKTADNQYAGGRGVSLTGIIWVKRGYFMEIGLSVIKSKLLPWY